MSKLAQRIEEIQAKLDSLRRQSLNETATRVILVNPLLEALGWDIMDPAEVQHEYPTVDGKPVDYALKLNSRPVLLVEAKALGDPLTDVKATTQIVSYAANDGIVWCILTNGAKWKVYRSIEKCPAPDKLMFEVSLDPRDSEGVTVAQLAQQMGRFSRDEMAKGALDTLGEQTFTDGKVRKALAKLMREPPRQFLNIIRQLTGDDTVKPQVVRESLQRVCLSIGIEDPVSSMTTATFTNMGAERRIGRAETKDLARRRRGRTPKGIYSESQHTAGKPQEVIELYRAIDRFCLSLKPGLVLKRILAKWIAYEVESRPFCSFCLQQGGLRVWLRLKYSRVDDVPSFARDVTNVGHWGSGNFELSVTSRSQIDETLRLVRLSFNGQR